MKYEAKLDNINISNEHISSIDVNVYNETKEDYINDKNRIEVIISGNLYSKDNGKVFKNIPINDFLNIKNKYFDIQLSVDNISYFIKQVYIYRFIQKYIGGEGKYTLVLLQRFIGQEKEMEVKIVDENKNS